MKSDAKQRGFLCYFLVEIFHSPHDPIEKKPSGTEKDLNRIS